MGSDKGKGTISVRILIVRKHTLTYDIDGIIEHRDNEADDKWRRELAAFIASKNVCWR